MKNVFLKVGMPIICAFPVASASIMTAVEIATLSKDIEIVTTDDNILPMSVLQDGSLELKVKDKKTGKEIEDAVFTSDSELISIEKNKINAIAPGEATIKCSVDGYNEKEFILDVAKETYSYDLTKAFTPTIDKYQGSLALSEATKTYLEKANENGKIIAEDLAHTWIDGGIISAGWKTLDVTPVYVTSSKSFVNIKIHATGEVNQDSSKNTLVSQDIEYRNIPVMINHTSEMGGIWGMSTSMDYEGQYLLTHDDWLYYQKDVYAEGQVVEHYWDAEKIKNDPEKESDIDIIMIAVSFSLPLMSYYLSDAIPA